MHIGTGILSILCAWKWGDWKNWRKYESTMIYVAMCNLLYNFLYHDHLLWQYKPHHICSDALATYIILPATCLIFLSNLPDKVSGQLIKIIKFITIYFLFEEAYQKYGRLVYNYGWNILWSLAWLCMMFPMLILHHKKPLVAYVASMIAVIIMLLLFPINLR